MANSKIDFYLVNKQCLYCNIKLKIKNFRDIERKKFCSMRCLGTYHGKLRLSDPEKKSNFLASSYTLESNLKKSLKLDKHPLWVKREHRICIRCNSQFECKVNAKRKYCSFNCSLSHIHDNNKHDKVEKIEYSCIVCNNKFKRSINYKQNHKYCSYRCNGIDRMTNSNKERTDIEIIISDLLKSMNIGFKEQVNIKNISVVDFVIEDLLIFADGDYWHNLKDRRKKDLEKTNNLQDLGYKVLRFDGSFIKTEIDLVKKKITEFL